MWLSQRCVIWRLGRLTTTTQRLAHHLQRSWCPSALLQVHEAPNASSYTWLQMQQHWRTLMKRYRLLKTALWFIFQYISQLFREKINNQLKYHSQCNHQIRLITFPSSSSWLQPLYVLIDFKMLFLKCVFIPKNIVNWDLSCWLATVYAFIRLHRRCSPSSGSLRPVLHPKPAAKIRLTEP